MVNYM